MQFQHRAFLVIIVNVFVSLTLSSPTYADVVYKCKTQDGSRIFSGLPCGSNAQKTVYKNLVHRELPKESLPPRSGELLNETTHKQASVNNTGAPGAKAKAESLRQSLPTTK